MTIYAPVPPPFTCAICNEVWQHSPWSPFRVNNPIPPLCNDCSQNYGRCIGGLGDLNRDRRIIRQISALAEAIDVAAYRASKGMGPHYG